MSDKKKIKIHSEDNKTEESKNSEKSDSSDKQAENLEPETFENESVEPPDPLEELEAKLAAREEEAKEAHDRLLRVSADYENYKKRSAREMEDFRKYANQSLLKEMLTVVDNLELAINSAKEEKKTDKKLIEGLKLTRNEMLRVFEKFNVKPISARGQTFDPAFHEAVMREETDDYPENTVLSEFQKGYLIHDRLLRPAMVVVAAPKSNED
ncbi:MAG: nucleotide exchange factor GrpE [Desulfobacterales bacterium]|jgi:molecular chaperone GrpE